VTTEAPVGGRRRAAARGALINSAFQIVLGTLNLLKAVIAAAFLTQEEFGVWSILFLGIALIIALKVSLVGDKYIQQEEDDQEAAFQKAFTLELLSTGLMVVGALALAPLLALAYGQGELLLPGLALALMLPGLALQSPIWVYYRRLDFLRQRLLLSVDPVVSFVVTVALAAAGAGYWSLVAGTVAGAAVGGIVAVIASPYRLRLRFDVPTLRSYAAFSLPLFVAVMSGLLIAQFSVFFGELALGLAGAGAIGLTAIITQWTDRADAVITQAMYPAICRVADQRELLREAFAKSNRIALMWAIPFGVALSLFADDIVAYVLGSNWEDVGILLQVFGLMAAVNHVGFNWNAFYRALGRTTPIAWVAAAALVAFCAAAIPLMFSHGLEGFATGMVVMTAVSLAGRVFYVLRLFPGFPVVAYVLRSVAPTVPAALAVLALRAAETGERSAALALGELLVYTAVTIVATAAVERSLLREMLGYLRRARAGAEPTAA